jgi:3-hydroxybutyryl-CoA dehydrogenase
MIFKSAFGFSTVRSFGVVGAGQMGTGIAIVANHVAKLPVTIYDSNLVSLRKSREFVNNWLKKEQDKNRINSDQIT